MYSFAGTRRVFLLTALPTMALTLLIGCAPGGDDALPGLTNALSGNPEAAQAFVDRPNDPDRIEYLLEEGTQADLDAGAFDHEADLLGNVLDAATQFEPDGERAHRIAEQVVNTLGAEAPSSNPNPDRDDFNIAPEMRDSIANILIRNLDHVNSTFTIVGSLDNEPQFEQAALNRVLQEVAYDPETYATLFTLQRGETAYVLNNAAANGSPTNLETRARSLSTVLAALDRGMTFAATAAELNAETDYEAELTRTGRISNYALGGSAIAVAAEPPLGSDVTFAGSEFIRRLVVDARSATGPAAATPIASAYADSRLALNTLTVQALWDNGAIPFDPAYPQLFRETEPGVHGPIPLSEMDAQQWTLFHGEYVRDARNDFNERIGIYASEVEHTYTDGRAIANQARGMP